jgi:virulence-associated protein VapD
MTSARFRRVEIQMALDKKQEELLEAFERLRKHFDRFEFQNPLNGHFSTYTGQKKIEEASAIVDDIARKAQELQIAKSLAKMGRLYV